MTLGCAVATPLTSWRAGPIKAADTGFVAEVTEPSSAGVVPPAEQVVGSEISLSYAVRDGRPVLEREGEIAFVDDKAGKPVDIQRHIGRRPILAFGSSDGDDQRLEWTTSRSGRRLGLILRHDDSEREYAYDRERHMGRMVMAPNDAEGMRPRDTGFDEYYGYYPAQEELSQADDKRRYPDLVLNPERLEMLRATGASEALVHTFRGGETKEVAQVRSMDDVAEADRTLKEFTVAKIADLAKGGKPFFLEH